MRQTKIRTDMLNLFSHLDNPISAPEILKVLSHTHKSINKTTVYRELAFLTNNHFLRQITFSDGLGRFEKEDEKCHHHLVCEECGAIKDVFLDEEKIINPLSKNTGFKIKRHSIEFFGLCKNCH